MISPISVQTAATQLGKMTAARLTILRAPTRHASRSGVLCLVLIWLLYLPVSSPGQEQIRETGAAAVSFTNEIAPLLLQKCQACHGPEKSKGGYRLHTFESLIQGGESKEAAITPGQPEKSKLFQLITARDDDDRMPQKDDPLPAGQIALIERWIKEGAKFDGPDPKAPLIALIPRPRQPDPPEVYLHPLPVLSLAFRPDGNELAAGGYHEITVWNPANGKLVRRISNVAQRTHGLAYNAAGTLLAAASGTPGKGGEVKLFDPTDGSLIRTLGISSDSMLAVCFSSNANQLAAGGADNAIRIFDVASGKQTLWIEQHADWILGLAFSLDGGQIVSASRDKTARIFDSQTGELESTYVGHGDAVFTAAFSPDGKKVYSAGRDKKIHVWEVKDAKKVAEMGGFEDDLLRIVVEGDFIFSCSADRKARQHSAEKRELLRTFAGHTDFVYALAYHEPTRRLATGSYDGEVRIWNIDSGDVTISFKASPGHLANK